MGKHRRITIVLIAISAGFSAVLNLGCKEKSEAPPAPPQSTVPSAQTPADQLAPGELAQGKENAFGFALPRRMQIEARFGDAVFASGQIPPEQVANYVRKYTIADGIETGPAKTIFAKVTLKEAPATSLRIEVIAQGSITKLVVRNETRAPAKEGLSEEERWKELGLSPRGDVLDPTQLE